MKKVIIPGIALLLGATAANAQAKNEFKYGLTEIPVAPFEKIKINANVQVVLVQNSSVNKVFVEGDHRLLNTISITSVNGELVISPTATFTGKEGLLLTIPVSNVKQVAVKGEAKIESVASL